METSDHEHEPATPRNWLPDHLQLLGWTAEHASQQQLDGSLAAFLCGEPFDSRALYHDLVRHGLRDKASAIQKHFPAFVPLVKSEDMCQGFSVLPPTLSLPDLLKAWVGPPADLLFDFEYGGALDELRILEKLGATKARIRRLRVVVILAHETQVDGAANFFKHCAGVKHESLAIVFSDANAPADCEHAVGKFFASLLPPLARLKELRLTLVHGDLLKIPAAGALLDQVLPQLDVLGLCSSGEALAKLVEPILAKGHALQTLRLKERAQPLGSMRGERSWPALIEALAALPSLKALAVQAHGLGGLGIGDELRIAFRRAGLLQVELSSYEVDLVPEVIEACLRRNARRGDGIRSTPEVEAVLLARKLFADRQLPWKDVDMRLGACIVDVAHGDPTSRNAVMRLVSPAVVKALESDRAEVAALLDACSHFELYEVVCDALAYFILGRPGFPRIKALLDLRWDLEDHHLALDAPEVFAVVADAMNTVVGPAAPGAGAVETAHGAPAQPSPCVLFTRQWLSLQTGDLVSRQEWLFAWIRARIDDTLRETAEYLRTLKIAQEKIDRVMDDLRRAIHANVLMPWLEQSFCQHMGIAFPVRRAGTHEAAAPRH